MGTVIAAGSTDHNFVIDGRINMKYDRASVVERNQAVRLFGPYGSLVVHMAGTSINGAAFDENDDIGDFYAALAGVAVGAPLTASGTDSAGDALPADFRVTGYDDYTTPGVVVFNAESVLSGKTYTKTIDKTAQPRTFGEWVEDAP